VTIYTSGFSPVPGSPNPADWRWHPTPYHSQPITFRDWADNQPDNYQGKGQDIIVLLTRGLAPMYKWADLVKSHNANNQFCHVCECSATDCT
jgi:hypothetical protein